MFLSERVWEAIEGCWTPVASRLMAPTRWFFKCLAMGPKELGGIECGRDGSPRMTECCLGDERRANDGCNDASCEDNFRTFSSVFGT